MAIASGIPVKSGTYLNTRRFTFAQVKDGDRLPGGAEDRWVRVPVVLAIAAAPVLGGIFVVAFPIIGAAALVNAIARKLVGGVKETAADLAANLAPGPVAGEAHLTGTAGEKKEGGPAPELDALKKEIEEKRQK